MGGARSVRAAVVIFGRSPPLPTDDGAGKTKAGIFIRDAAAVARRKSRRE